MASTNFPLISNCRLTLLAMSLWSTSLSWGAAAAATTAGLKARVNVRDAGAFCLMRRAGETAAGNLAAPALPLHALHALQRQM